MDEDISNVLHPATVETKFKMSDVSHAGSLYIKVALQVQEIILFPVVGFQYESVLKKAECNESR